MKAPGTAQPRPAARALPADLLAVAEGPSYPKPTITSSSELGALTKTDSYLSAGHLEPHTGLSMGAEIEPSPPLVTGQWRPSKAPGTGQTPLLATEIVAVTRLSKLEYLAGKHRKSVHDFKEELSKGSARDLLLVESHERQKSTERAIATMLGVHHLVSRDQVSSEALRSAKLVLSIGGDNHLQYVAQFVEDTPLVGVNSDPEHSDGVLCSLTFEDLPHFLERLAQGNYLVEKWARADVETDGMPIGRALCDIGCGELHFFEMSKHLLNYRGRQDLHKGSGLLIATGAGSTGWYSSVRRQSGALDSSFARTSPELRFILREPYAGRLPANTFPEGDVREGEELVLESLNDSQGIVILDSLTKAAFPLGSIMKVKLSEHPLRVLFVN